MFNTTHLCRCHSYHQVSWRIKEGLGSILDATLDYVLDSSSDKNQSSQEPSENGGNDRDDTVLAQSSSSSSSSSSLSSSTHPSDGHGHHGHASRKSRLVPGAKSKQVYVNGYDVDGHATVIYTPTNEATCSIDDCVFYLVRLVFSCVDS